MMRRSGLVWKIEKSRLAMCEGHARGRGWGERNLVLRSSDLGGHEAQPHPPLMTGADTLIVAVVVKTRALDLDRRDLERAGSDVLQDEGALPLCAHVDSTKVDAGRQRLELGSQCAEAGAILTGHKAEGRKQQEVTTHGAGRYPRGSRFAAANPAGTPRNGARSELQRPPDSAEVSNGRSHPLPDKLRLPRPFRPGPKSDCEQQRQLTSRRAASQQR